MSVRSAVRRNYTRFVEHELWQRPQPPRALAMSADYPRIRSVRLNRWERPLRATVWTKYGMVKVVWRDVAGDQCWFASGTGDAEREAVPAIEHIEQMCMTMH